MTQQKGQHSEPCDEYDGVKPRTFVQYVTTVTTLRWGAAVAENDIFADRICQPL
jgi:hypothetical protein